MPFFCFCYFVQVKLLIAFSTSLSSLFTILILFSIIFFLYFLFFLFLFSFFTTKIYYYTTKISSIFFIQFGQKILMIINYDNNDIFSFFTNVIDFNWIISKYEKKIREIKK